MIGNGIKISNIMALDLSKLTDLLLSKISSLNSELTTFIFQIINIVSHIFGLSCDETCSIVLRTLVLCVITLTLFPSIPKRILRVISFVIRFILLLILSSVCHVLDGVGVQLSSLHQLYTAHQFRKLADTHFQHRLFREAICLYDAAIEHIPESHRHQPYHPRYASLLASRASACIALARAHLVARRAYPNPSWNSLTPSHPQAVSTATLISSVLRLVHYYLSHLDSHAAGLVLDIIKTYQSEVGQEYTQLASRINFLSAHEKKIRVARSRTPWDETLDIIESVEKEISDWGLDINLASLPGDWPFWKAQALVRLDRPLGAAVVLSGCDPTNSLYQLVWQEISQCNHSYSRSSRSTNSSRSSRPTNNSQSSRPINNTELPTEDPWDPKGYYHTLGVSKDADIETITKVFRKLSMAHHPDKGGCTEVYQGITAAYSVLSKTESRADYDFYGR
ncbi:hypothetical protein PCANC_18426 [Puccinia coronata f. sp. avenae]|uniref:J domain-containing protein n=1 Tax=Puccinia coronata f. sp. avenae TaxID=200324 RepID=A0A2N5SKC1_9BASI|nr:hypothetical protein PCANC_18426 [Puccinia coronata f. sp. avenae]